MTRTFEIANMKINFILYICIVMFWLSLQLKLNSFFQLGFVLCWNPEKAYGENN